MLKPVHERRVRAGRIDLRLQHRMTSLVTDARRAEELANVLLHLVRLVDRLGRKVTQLAPTRNDLIAKGMIWSPMHGHTAFTVPLFDEFMHRIMPAGEWRA